MMIGHYAVSLAARSCRNSPPLWAFAAAAQLLDIVWCVLILAGVEHFKPAPGLSGSALVFTDYPWSHSLAAAFAWSGLTWLAARYLFAQSRRDALLLALVVLSHWPLDLLVHRPDLPLWPYGPAVGLSLWNHPVFEGGLEVIMVAATSAWWSLCLWSQGRRPWRAWIFGGVLIALFLAAGSAIPADAPTVGSLGLGFYLFAIGLAWLVDRPWARGAKTSH